MIAKYPVTMSFKACTACGDVKPAADFSVDRYKKSGLTSSCRLCNNERTRKWYKDPSNSITTQNRNRRYRLAHREKRLEASRKWVARNRDKQRKYLEKNKLAKYGLSIADYELMVEACGNLCEICRRPEMMRQRGETLKLAVDHCHDIGRVRGLLCHSCNTSLGKFNHNPALLRSAADYLEKHKC